LATLRDVPFALPADVAPSWELIPVGTQGYVDVSAQRDGLIIRDESGGPPRLVAAPDSIEIDSHAVGPDGHDVAVLVAAGKSTILGIVSTKAWDLRPLARFPGRPFVTSLSWSTDGGIYFARWIPGSGAPTLFRVAAMGGSAPARVMSVPARCWVWSVVVATAAPRAACQTHDWRSDIYLASVPGVTR
jgi:hypothetical protein